MKLGLGGNYEVETEVPSSDMPCREDLRLIRRQQKETPFHGVWIYKAVWNLFNLEGPTAAASDIDLDL